MIEIPTCTPSHHRLTPPLPPSLISGTTHPLHTHPSHPVTTECLVSTILATDPRHDDDTQTSCTSPSLSPNSPKASAARRGQCWAAFKKGGSPTHARSASLVWRFSLISSLSCFQCGSSSRLKLSSSALRLYATAKWWPKRHAVSALGELEGSPLSTALHRHASANRDAVFRETCATRGKATSGNQQQRHNKAFPAGKESSREREP